MDLPVSQAAADLYHAYGLIFRSEFPVFGAIKLSPGEGLSHRAAFDIVVRPREADIGCAYGFDRDTGELHFSIETVARFRCRRDLIAITPYTTAADAEIGNHLVANALPAMLWLRGDTVLHAAGVMPGKAQQAIAVCGASGNGKSTVLKALLERGARVIGDDTLRIPGGPGGASASGLAAQYCWSSEAKPGRAWRDIPPQQRQAAAPLSAIFILERPRLADGFRFERLSGIEAVHAVLRQRHRAFFSQSMQTEAVTLSAITALAKLPVYRWFRQDGALQLAPGEMEFLNKQVFANPVTRKENGHGQDGEMAAVGTFGRHSHR